MANIYSRILVFSLISFFIVLLGYFQISVSVSILGLVAGFGSVLEKSGLGTIYNNFLGVEKVVLWHGSAEDCRCWHWIIWPNPLSMTSCSEGGHMCRWKWDCSLPSDIFSFTVTGQVLLFCIGKIVSLRHFCKPLNIHNFFAEEGKAMMNTPDFRSG